MLTEYSGEGGLQSHFMFLLRPCVLCFAAKIKYFLGTF